MQAVFAVNSYKSCRVEGKTSNVWNALEPFMLQSVSCILFIWVQCFGLGVFWVQVEIQNHRAGSLDNAATDSRGYNYTLKPKL